METVIDNTTIKKYPAYKGSGVEWIEDVPSHWEVKKFKRVFYEIKKRSNPELNCGSISFGKVVYKDDEKIPESTKRSYQVVQKGDFLVNPLNLNYDLISLRIALSDINVVVSSGYIVLSNSVKLDKTFYKYFLHRFDVAFMKLLGSGVRQTLNWNDIANCDLIFPPLSEQTAIAAFLDRKTALIDQAIDIKQKQIELLKERRQILINKAVTCGLNPKVKMKDSGVEWIGEIPEGWELIFMNYAIKAIADVDHYMPQTIESGVPYVMTGDLKEFASDIDFESCKKVSKRDYINLSKKIKSSMGDVILARYATIGTASYVNIDLNFIVSYSCVTIKPNPSKLLGLYLFYYFKSDAFVTDIKNQVNTNTQGNVGIGNLKKVKLVIPPINEQLEILKHLESTNTKIATAISLKKQEIEKLKEYKATLINSAVTGKIKVC